MENMKFTIVLMVGVLCLGCETSSAGTDSGINNNLDARLNQDTVVLDGATNRDGSADAFLDSEIFSVDTGSRDVGATETGSLDSGATDAGVMFGMGAALPRPSNAQDYGRALAITADSNNVAVGDPRERTVHVVSRVRDTWGISGYLTTPADAYRFGESVAIAADGRTVLVSDTGVHGTVRVFTKTGDTWDEGQLLPKPPTGTAYFGSGLAISDDSNTIAVGDREGVTDPVAGAIYVFSRTMSGWISTKLFGGLDERNYGMFLSMAADGNTIVGSYFVGASGTLNAIKVFSRSGGVWDTGVTLSTLPGSTPSYTRVAVSPDGNTIATVSGELVVYKREGGVWGEGVQLIVPDDMANVGSALVVNTDLIAVSDYTRGPSGQVFVYAYEAGRWNFLQTLVPLDGASFFGTTVDISTDSRVIAVGDYSGGGDRGGSVTIFQR